MNKIEIKNKLKIAKGDTMEQAIEKVINACDALDGDETLCVENWVCGITCGLVNITFTPFINLHAELSVGTYNSCDIVYGLHGYIKSL